MPCSRFILLLLLTHRICFAQVEELPPPPSAEEVEQIKIRSTALLANISPSSKQGPLSTGKIMQSVNGIVRWGHLFSRDEVVALVNLAPPPSTEPFDYPPQYLSYFAWNKGQWVFRQFLGNAYNLEIHYRKDAPSVFLQGSYRSGRYDGEHLSWFYDPKTRQLVKTGFEDWGAFFLAGNYLVCTRGFERLAHDETYWIYAYKDGRKGPLLAIYHTNDSGRFDISFRNKTGRTERWHFEGSWEHDDKTPVSFHEDASDLDKHNDDELSPSELDAKGELITPAKSENGLTPEYCFVLLTGLNPALLGRSTYEHQNEDEWRDDLPTQLKLARVPIIATGDPKIIERFQWPPKKSTGQ